MHIAIWLVLLSAVTAHGGCDRLLAQHARALIADEIVPFLGKIEALPEECMLRPEKDSLKEQEAAKERQGASMWKCGLCGKRFRSEWYLDKHLELRHTDHRSPKATLCYADLCGVLVACGRPENQQLINGEVVTIPPIDEPAWCNHRDEIAARTRLCASILRSCVKKPKLLAQLESIVCSSAPADHCRQFRSWRRRSSARSEYPWETLRVAFGIIAILATAVFVAILFLIQRDTRANPDLRIPRLASLRRSMSGPRSHYD